VKCLCISILYLRVDPRSKDPDELAFKIENYYQTKVRNMSTSSQPQQRLICIQGNIGSGKSTVVHLLESHQNQNQSQTQNYVCMLEPVNLWNDYQMHGKNILEHFYADRKRYAFPFQMMAFYTRLQAMRELPNDRTIIMERSVETDKKIFAQMLMDDGSIDPICARIYNEWYADLVTDNDKIMNIYIRTPPDVCLQRIATRGRSGEEGISLDYLTRCHDLHEQWLMDTAHVIDGTKATEDIMSEVLRLVN
jgi:deoxyadenosine/deoxycytidine kinase